MMVFRWISIFFALISFSSIVNAQVVDQVTFSDVMPPFNAGTDSRSFVINNSGDINSIRFSGVITATDSAPFAFALDVLFDYSGSGLSGNSIQLSTEATFDETIEFEGVINVLSTSINSGDEWVFDFIDVVGDSPDGSTVDVNLDITFELGVDLQGTTQVPPLPVPPTGTGEPPADADIIDKFTSSAVLPEIDGTFDTRSFTIKLDSSKETRLHLMSFWIIQALVYLVAIFSYLQFQHLTVSLILEVSCNCHR